MAASSASIACRPPHPTAKALFDALDVRDEKENKQSLSSWIKKRTSELGWRNRHSQMPDYPLRVAGTDFTVKQVQRGEVEGTYGTGATVWPASMVLIKYLERHAKRLFQISPEGGPIMRVADLGAGTGVTSIATALLMENSEGKVVCTDGSDNVVSLARENVEQVASTLSGTENSVQDKEGLRINKTELQVCKYWWGDGSLKPLQSFDLVLVSDCVLPKLYPIAPLVEALDELLTPLDGVAILSYEHRYFADYDPRKKFRELAEARGFQVQVIAMQDQDPVYSAEDIEIWQVRRQAM